MYKCITNIFIRRNVQELESSLGDVIKALFRESEVEDKDHTIGKIQERIQGLHRYLSYFTKNIELFFFGFSFIFCHLKDKTI